MSHHATAHTPILSKFLRSALLLGLATFSTAALANPPPATCQDLKNAGVLLDGESTLYLGNDLNRPWRAYCHNMSSISGTPAEYLTLSNTGGDYNFSQYTTGTSSPGTSVRTSYSKLRINPVTLNVNISDKTFASSTGELLHAWRETFTSMSYATAMSCGTTQTEGKANIDLQGTPFEVIPGQLMVRGNEAFGSITYSQGNQVVNQTGGGNCGWTGLTGTSHDGGDILKLKYRWLPATCQELKSANPSLTDGEYTLYLGRAPNRPWTVYCHNMSGTPAEYLTLVNTGGDSNFSQYTTGTSSPGTNVRTSYSKLRIDPVLRIDPITVKVNITDQTFASSTGELLHAWREPLTSMSYATAMSCGTTQTEGKANIDLRETPFQVIPGQLLVRGNEAFGSVTYSPGNQVVDQTGGGNCGWTGLPGGAYSELFLAYP
jgi:hypothetical protein